MAEKFNKEFEGMSEEERFRILQVVPEIAEKAQKLLEMVNKKEHLKRLTEPEATAWNLFDRELKHPTPDYSNNPNNKFIREKDGTMYLNQKVSDVQKKAIKSVLGQIAKKIITADLTGLTLPVFLFHSDTYLHK